MRWADVDLDAKWWTLPESATKNRVTHRVPLTDRVVELLKEAKTDASRESLWVFAGVTGGSVAARARKAGGELKRAERKSGERLLSFSFHRHDLRRTCATNMAMAGIPRTTISRVLNHVDRSARADRPEDFPLVSQAARRTGQTISPALARSSAAFRASAARRLTERPCPGAREDRGPTSISASSVTLVAYAGETLMIARTLSHDRIVSALGSGGPAAVRHRAVFQLGRGLADGRAQTAQGFASKTSLLPVVRRRR
jgi:hypothetical protein